MRIVANYGSSLLDYLNNDKDINDVFNEEIDDSCLSTAAKKTLEEHGIKLSSRNNSSKTNSSKTNSKDDKTYNEIRTTTEELRNHAALLASTSKDNIYSKAEASGKTNGVVSEITNFVTQYNKMHKQMNTMGGEKNQAYAKELTEYVKINEEQLKKIGITQDEKGVLSINSDTLSKAALTDLKKAFAGDNSFADTVARKSVYVEANVISAMYTSTVSNYSNSGSFLDAAASTFNQGF